MGEKRKGPLILLLATIGSFVVLLMLFRLSDTGATLLGKFVSYFISPFLFPMLQRKEFEKWKVAHPDTKPAGGWSMTGWAIAGAVGFLGLAVSLPFTPFFSEVHDLEALVYASRTAMEKEVLEIEVQIQNTSSRPQTLLEIGIGDGLLQGITIRGSDPQFAMQRAESLSQERVYEFHHELPPNSKTIIHIAGNARAPGRYAGQVSVCINSSLSCLYYDLEVTVTPRK